MSIVTRSARGQIVIPKDIRRQLKIKPGKKLLLKVEGEPVVIRPLLDDPVEEFCGFFAGGSSLTKALLDERERIEGWRIDRVERRSWIQTSGRHRANRVAHGLKRKHSDVHGLFFKGGQGMAEEKLPLKIKAKTWANRPRIGPIQFLKELDGIIEVQRGITNQPTAVIFDSNVTSREDIYSALLKAGFEVITWEDRNGVYVLK
jgi:AbrB family looped-hinge helix DNA binding protein